jgi:small subunit ribosomal protein S11
MPEEKATIETKAPSAKAKSKKKKAVRQVSQGCAYVQATYNNTLVTITDVNGNTLAQASAGGCGFRGPKKATPYAASLLVKKVADQVKENGLREISVFVKGVGQGRDSAVRALNANGFHILSIKDITPLPHNGCRPPKPRRM